MADATRLTRNQMRCLMEACAPGGSHASSWSSVTVKSLLKNGYIEQRWRQAVQPNAPRATRVSIYVTTLKGVERMRQPLKPKSNGYTPVRDVRALLAQTRVALERAQQWLPPHDGAAEARALVSKALKDTAGVVK